MLKKSQANSSKGKSASRTAIKKTQAAAPASLETQENASDAAFRALANEFGKIDADKIEFFLACKKYKAEIDLKQESFWNQYDLSNGRFQILLILRCTPGYALSASALADKVKVSRGSMTQFLDALEKSSYITREDFPGDRRAVLIKISAKALKILNKKLLPLYFERSAKFSENCSKQDMKRFAEVYKRISQNLSDYELK